MPLRDWLAKAQREQFAIGQFNVSNLEEVHAVVRAAEALRAPLIIGVSEGERTFFGVQEIVAVIELLRKETGLPIFVNADHTHAFEKIQEAVDAGFDAVHFDGSRLPYEENANVTKQSVEYAQGKNPAISVEGELGYLRGASEVQEAVEISPDDFTDPDQAADFVARTGVDRLAPVFGNIHGIMTKSEEKLDLGRLRAIRAKTNAFLVLHGGSGIGEEDIRGAIREGIVKINVNTALRVAYRQALEQGLRDMPQESAPYKYLAPAVEAVEKVAGEEIALFGSAGKVAS